VFKKENIAMLRFVVFAAAVAASLGQLVDERAAKIIKEQRFNNGDGRAGAAFATENEILFREEQDEAGNRVGQYSYPGDDGQIYTVKYVAGKDGFRILDGAHIPSTGQDAAAYVATPAPPPAPVQAPVQQAARPVVQARPAPRRPAPQPIQAEPLIPDYVEYDDEPVDPNFNPFINPHDPTHRNFAHNKNGAKFAPKIPGVLDASNVPNCAGCEGLNPFVNPFDATHSSSFVGDTRNAGLLAGHQAGFRAAAPRRPAQAQQAARPQASRPLAADPRLFTTTQRPIRQFPPGKLALNRFETGFNFDFSS